MDKRGSVELINMESTNYNKNLSLDSYRSDSKPSPLNSKQESVSGFNIEEAQLISIHILG